jgi:RimJ/RimL family protein N-acetyltransferase
MEIYLRFAAEDDARLLYLWRNHSGTRKYARNTENFSYESHLEWFKASLKDPNKNIFLAVDETGERVGQIRFERDGGMAQIDIAVSPAMQGKCIGTVLLKTGCDRYLNNWDVDYLFAEIRKENIASIRIFEKAGFKIREEDDEMIRMRLCRRSLLHDPDSAVSGGMDNGI